MVHGGGSVKVAALGDLHGRVSGVEVPECDLLLVTGDLGPIDYFDRWLDRAWSRAGRIVGIAGNHDLFAEKRPDLYHELDWTYLEGDTVQVLGLKIWGGPWTPPFLDWAFMRTEPELEERWSWIPDDVDVLLTHGPPWGTADWSNYGMEHTGSTSLAARIAELSDLRLHVFGHIHEGRGRGFYRPGCEWANVALLDENYDRYPQAVEVFEL